MVSEGVCSSFRWFSLISILEMESVTSAPDATIIDVGAIAEEVLSLISTYVNN